MGIEYEGQSGANAPTRYKTAIEYIESNTTISSHLLKIKLIKDGIKEHKCELCELSEWRGQPIPLELHHIDGNHQNNDLKNLQILCPNCHAQMDNNSGSANKKTEEEKREKKYSGICIDCGKPIIKGATRCPECWSIANRKVDRPDRGTLKNLIRTDTFVQIGLKYNVSDNAVRKWCKAYNLPTKKKEINMISDENWINI